MVKKVNGKNVNIDDEKIDNLIETFGISIDEAVQMYLEDEGLLENEVIENLTKKAKDNKVTATIHGAKGKKEKAKRERTRKEDPDKEKIIEMFKDFLIEKVQGENVNVVNIGKIIEFDYNGEHYKLDLIKQRKGK